MATPADFYLQPLSGVDGPPPAPPRYVKPQIYTDVRNFKAVDKHAVDEARTNYRNFRDLIWNLIHKKNYTDLEKARTIFRWMTTKNMFTIMFDSELPGSPEQVIASFKDQKATYARIFECLCSYAGLFCMTISGWAKGVEYRPGAPLTSAPLNHSWNAVSIDGSWQLVDSHWATRYLQSEKNTPDNLVYEYDDFYFVPEPAHLVYSHCPEDPSWQLLHPARSRSEFEEYPLVKSFFFSVGMRFLRQNQGVVYTRDGLLTLTLGYTRPTAFTFKLVYGEHLLGSVGGVALKRCVLQETTDDRVTFYMRAPRDGEYYLTVFSQLVSERAGAMGAGSESVFKAACEYRVVCSAVSDNARPYPLCSHANWGAGGGVVASYGLTPSQRTAIVRADRGRAELWFARARPHVRLYARLTCDGIAAESLEPCVDVVEEGEDGRVVVTVSLPAAGEFGLEVYANEPDREGDTFTHVCQYLLVSTSADLAAVYGQVFDRADLAYASKASPLFYASSAAQTAAGVAPGLLVAPPPPAASAQPYQDWEEGGTISQRMYRDEMQDPDGSGTFRQMSLQGSEMDSRRQQPTTPTTPQYQEPYIQKLAVAKRPERIQPERTVILPSKVETLKKPKPPIAARVQQEDYPPPPPPELMDQAYSTAQRRAQGGAYSPPGGSTLRSGAGAERSPPDAASEDGGEKLPPIELVYVSAGATATGQSPKSPTPGTGAPPGDAVEDEAGRRSPVQIVYVGGRSPQVARKPAASVVAAALKSREDQLPPPPLQDDGDTLRNGTGVRGYGGRPEDGQFPPPPPGGDTGSLKTTRMTIPITSQQTGGANQKGGAYDQKGVAYDQKGRAYDQKGGAYDQKGEAYDQKGVAYDQKGRAYDQKGGAYDQKGGAYDQKGRAYDQKGGAYDQKGEAYDQKGVAYDQKGGTYDQKGGAYDQKGGTYDQRGGAYDQKGGAYDQMDRSYDKRGGAQKPGTYEQMSPDRARDQKGAVYDQKGGAYDQRGGAYDQRGAAANQGQGAPSMYDQQKPTSVGAQSMSYPFGSLGRGRSGGGEAGDGSAGGRGGAGPFESRTQPAEPETEYTPHSRHVYSTSITVQPPAHFKPEPVQETTAPEPAPPSVPPKPFKDAQVFQNVDTHAVEVSKEEHSSFRDLVWHLIYARDITNELDKARAIFLWLCSKDLSKLSFESVVKGSPEEILISLQQGKTTYAVVYEILCKYAGLHCKTISGYAKGAEYKPGMKFVDEQGKHSWNSVLVNGAWRLVDCHWAARRLVGKKVSVENVRYELDEYYFMPDPHQLIFTHLPVDASWQLLSSVITLADFERLVPVKSAFFKYGLQILSHREAVVRTSREVTVRVGCPRDRAAALAFTFTLTAEDGRDELDGTKLNRYGMQEMLDGVSFFTVRPPRDGAYRLIIYAKDVGEASADGVYGGVCEYELRSEGGTGGAPFPPCVHTSWGAGDSAGRYQVEPLQRGAIFSTVGGRAELRLRLGRPLRFTAKLKSNTHDESLLAGHVIQRVIGGDTAVFTVAPPAPGEYGLEIYANDPERDGNSLYHAYQYLVVCDALGAGGAPRPLPTLPPGYLGPQPSFASLGLTCVSHADPYVEVDGAEVTVSVAVQPGGGGGGALRMTSQLLAVAPQRTDDVSEYVLQQGGGTGGATSFVIRPPRPGVYKLQLYALPTDDASESLPGVYNYLLVAASAAPAAAPPQPFPRQYGQWKDGCFLHSPTDAHLVPAGRGRPLSFRLEVDKANSVAVVVGDDWTQLERSPAGVWEGEVPLDVPAATKVAVCANYGSVQASYSTLLEFSL